MKSKANTLWHLRLLAERATHRCYRRTRIWRIRSKNLKHSFRKMKPSRSPRRTTWGSWCTRWKVRFSRSWTIASRRSTRAQRWSQTGPTSHTQHGIKTVTRSRNVVNTATVTKWTRSRLQRRKTLTISLNPPTILARRRVPLWRRTLVRNLTNTSSRLGTLRRKWCE